jgi:hypothetical protein
MAVRTDSSPKKMIRFRQDSLMLRTNLSAWAFRFGDRGGSLTVSTPVSVIVVGEQWITVVNQVPFSDQNSVLRIREISGNLAHPQSLRCWRPWQEPFVPVPWPLRPISDADCH